MTMAPENEDESTLAATVAECLDCGATNRMENGECEFCGSTMLEYLHVSGHALGFQDDANFHIHAGPGGPERWVYHAANPG